jgi:O-antigen/teichoic acid export membrane protein
VALFVFAPQLMVLFCGYQYTEAILAMRIMSFLPWLIGLGHFWGYQVAFSLGKDTMLLKAALAGVFSSLVLNILLAPVYGHTGAALASMVAEVIVTLLYFLQVRPHVIASIPYSLNLKALLACSPFFLFLVFPLEPLSPLALWAIFGWGAISLLLYLLFQTYIFRHPLLLPLADEAQKRLQSFRQS